MLENRVSSQPEGRPTSPPRNVSSLNTKLIAGNQNSINLGLITGSYWPVSCPHCGHRLEHPDLGPWLHLTLVLPWAPAIPRPRASAYDRVQSDSDLQPLLTSDIRHLATWDRWPGAWGRAVVFQVERLTRGDCYPRKGQGAVSNSGPTWSRAQMYS